MATPTRKPPVYTVYVIELSPDVLSLRRFAEANPGYTYDPTHPRQRDMPSHGPG